MDANNEKKDVNEISNNSNNKQSENKIDIIANEIKDIFIG